MSYSATSDKKREMNRRAAKKQAEKNGWNAEEMLFCQKCGRTTIRRQKIGNPGFKDKVFCTCDERGLPMIPVED